MKKLFFSLLLLALVSNFSFSQERIITKPNGFDPSKISVTPVQTTKVTTEIRKMQLPDGVATISPNIRIVPTTGNQTELSSTIWRGNSNYVFVGANSDPGQGYYYTTNGGNTWLGGDLLPGTISSSSDPACVYNNTGRLYFNYFDNTMACDRSTNGGTNWLGRVTVPSPTSFDKNHMAVDDNPSSPYLGRVYVVWSNFALATPPTVLSYSTDNGATFSAMQQIGSPQSGHYEQGCNIQVAPNGDVYCIWASVLSSGLTEDYIGFTKSTNGGVTWSAISYIDVNGIRGNILSTNIRVNSFPSMAVDRSGGARNGYIYITWGQRSMAPAGSDADIVFCSSSNGGTNWSSVVRVNDDPLNNGKQQFMPWMTVDQTNGNIGIVFYDTRDVSSTDSCNTYLAVSANGGTSFTNMKVSDMAQRPAPLSGYATGYFGDYLAISAHNNIFWPFWMDKRVGPAQIYTAKVELGPSITHTPLGNTESTTGNRTVDCIITPAGSPITPSTVKLYYSLNNPTLTSNVTMTNSSGNNWTASLPLSGAGLYRYYITATDGLSRTATYPAGAPASTVQFTASPDTVKPVITHTAIGSTPKTSWPVSVTASVTDNIGVDSAWVIWRINSGVNKRFKLLNTSGSTYAALFNSINSDVNINDVIYYKIYAQDNSSNHNRDSSAQYNFTIINLTNVCVGTGTTSSNYPFTTYWMDGRTQLLFTAAELTAAGIGANSAITKIGFNILTRDAATMNGFSVKFQATTQTSLTAFVTTGTWFTGFSGTYSVPGTGQQDITMTNPFNWNGTSNMLIEICYDNSAYTQYSTVASTAAAGMTWGYYTDNSTGCTMTGGAVQANRPNVCFTFTTGVGVNQNGSEIPKVYSLSQNYPNPFNPVTKINFALPKQGMVTLKIYDVLGREVRTLVNEVKSAGQFSVDFNASEFASGVYFYRLESEGFSDIKRMMLIK